MASHTLTSGNDYFRGVSSESDSVAGRDGDDLLDGRGGSDLLLGGKGEDQLLGRNGADTLFGGAGDDILKGGSGQDTLSGDKGADQLYGGNGDDTFVLNANSAGVDGWDTVHDFAAGDDTFYFKGFSFWDISFVQDGTDVDVYMGGGEMGEGTLIATVLNSTDMAVSAASTYDDLFILDV